MRPVAVLAMKAQAAACGGSCAGSMGFIPNSANTLLKARRQNGLLVVYREYEAVSYHAVRHAVSAVGFTAAATDILPATQVSTQATSSSYRLLQQSSSNVTSSRSAPALQTRHSTTTASASRHATAIAAVAQERIEEKELHVEASESYLAVSSCSAQHS